MKVSHVFSLIAGLLFSSVSFSQNYSTYWKSIDSLDKKGLPESALQRVRQIRSKAVREKNQLEYLKASLHWLKFSQDIYDDSLVTQIRSIEQEVKGMPEPQKQLTLSYLAEFYSMYATANQWQFQGRTKVQIRENPDFSSWDYQSLLDQSAFYYRQSLVNPKFLFQTKAENYQLILTQEENSKALASTLYDVLAMRYTTFLGEHFNGLENMNESGLLDYLEKCFVPGYVLLEQKRFPSDTSSAFLQALALHFQWLELHQNSLNSFVDVDLRRLNWLNARFNQNPKSKLLYEKALTEMLVRYAEEPVFAEISYLLAQSYRVNSQPFYSKRGVQQGEEDSESLLKARKLCLTALQKFPQAFYSPYCQLLLKDLEAPSISYQVEEIQMPGRSGLIKFTYKNLDLNGKPSTVYGRLVQIPASNQKEIMNAGGYYSNDLKKTLLQFPVYKELSWTFGGEQDLVSHSTECVLPSLTAGAYVLLVSRNQAFKNGEEIQANSFWCTSLAYSTADLSGERISFVVVNRLTGEAMEGAKVEIYNTEYNYSSGKNKQVLIDAKTTDKDGVAILEGNANIYNLSVKISKGIEVYWSNQQVYFSKEQEQVLDQNMVSLFTDRSIYRPGQTVFFKGIFYRQTIDESRPLVNKQVAVFLKDANFQDVSSLTLTSNEFGTFHGSFVLPKGKLNGEYRLYTGSGEVSFSVEEYKRPKFEANFIPPLNGFKLGDSFSLELEAKTFTGLPVENARVEVTVSRSKQMVWYWYGGRNQKTDVLAHPGFVTDAQGKVKLNLVLTPPANSLESDLYNFSFDATVTDPSGESHTCSYSILVGAKPFQIQTSLGQEVDLDTLKQFYIQAKNSAGKSVKSVNGQVKIYSVTVPDKAFQKRFWSQPDRFTLNEQEFHKFFPEYAYSNEENRDLFPKKLLQTLNFNTLKDSLIPVKNWDGQQLVWIEITGAANGDTVKLNQFVELFSGSKPSPNSKDVLQARLLKEELKPGENLQMEWGHFLGMPVLLEVFVGNRKDHSQSIVMQQWMTGVAQKFQIKEIPLKPEWGKEVDVVLSGFWGNRKLQVKLSPQIVAESKEMRILVESMRDVMEPGKPEKWKLKLVDSNGKPMESELLASMYDASLDQFRKHDWSFNPNSLTNYVFLSDRNWVEFGNSNSTIISYKKAQDNIRVRSRQYWNLNWFGFSYYGERRYQAFRMLNDSEVRTKSTGKASGRKSKKEAEETLAAAVADGDGANGFVGGNFMESPPSTAEESKPDEQSGQNKASGMPGLRANLNETAFFLPQLRTNENGEVLVEFSAPEALTKWKFLAFATTKDLRFAPLVKEAVTRKSLMVTPNWPRFFREGDTILISTKINLLQELPNQPVMASLQVVNPLTGENLNLKVIRQSSPANFTSKTQGLAWWKLIIPASVRALELTIAAQAGDYSDAERMTLPVVPNRMLVTESLALEINPGESKIFHLEKLENNNSNTLTTQSLKLEFTSNPAWLAIQCLPYLMEGEKECSEQVFNRYYANTIAANVANSNPKIKAVFDQWGNAPAQLEKALGELAQTTPWLRNALNETEQKRRVAQLFDIRNLEAEQAASLQKLAEMQTAQGGFTWFPGMPVDRYMTQHILEGLAHLQQLKALNPTENAQVTEILTRGFVYLDQELIKDYSWLKKENKDWKNYRTNEIQLHYLYVRSLFSSTQFVGNDHEAHRFFINQIEKFWTEYDYYSKGLAAMLEFHRGQNGKFADMVKSLEETAIKKSDLGMYWKNNNAGYWYDAPIEANALMVEVFKAANNQVAVSELCKWLLKNKQTNHWESSKATADACYALLISGGTELGTETKVELSVGKQKNIPATDKNLSVEAGTGYFSKEWKAEQVSNEMGKVSVQNPGSKTVSWGGLYWTYFEQMDKITKANTSLSINKELYVEQTTDKGPVLVKLSPGFKLHKGDKVVVRIEISVDRPMEYVRLSDMRAAGFEPTQTLSEGHFQDGLYYYQSTKDLSTDFFIHYLQKGKYVFEYPLSVQQSGGFSNGITTIECMYAPEFSSHSAGVRVTVD
ncbi:MAG: hypothetical protein K1X82_04190 [Bacteroidia bacterium]|nr:hypothetical protein [Bacteroidia bacterium]